MKPHEDREHVLAELIAARLAAPSGSAPSEVDLELWEEAGKLAFIAAALRDSEAEVPPLEEDPVAASLGLVPDAHFTLEGRALASARKNAGTLPSDLAAALTRRGWRVTTRDIINWENRAAGHVPPALIAAMAAELGMDPERISVDRGGQPQSGLEAATQTPRFAQLADRLARLRGISVAFAASTLRSRGLATVHRGNEPDQDRWLDALESYVDTLETRREQ